MKLKRRQFIKSAASAATFGGLCLKSQKSSAQAAIDPPFLLTIHCDGGWDTTLVFDNKNTTSTVDTRTGNVSGVGAGEIPYVSDPNDRPAVDKFFAEQGESSLILNGIYSQALDHETAATLTMSTKDPASSKATDFLTFYASQIGPAKFIPHQVVDAPYLPGPYRTISYFSTDAQLAKHSAEILPTNEKFSTAETDALNTFLVANYTDMMTDNINATIDSAKIQSYISSYRKETSLGTFLSEYELDTTTNSSLLKHGKMALNMFNDGYSQAATIRAGSKKMWDTHTDNHDTQSQNFETLFDDINNIIAEAKSLGIDDKLTIIVQSELGRAPKLNSSGGKEHWPYTSILMWGLGVNGGLSLGKTTSNLVGYPVNPLFGTYDDAAVIPLTHSHLYAALYNIFGIPYTLLMPDITPASIILKAGA